MRKPNGNWGAYIFSTNFNWVGRLLSTQFHSKRLHSAQVCGFELLRPAGREFKKIRWQSSRGCSRENYCVLSVDWSLKVLNYLLTALFGYLWTSEWLEIWHILSIYQITWITFSHYYRVRPIIINIIYNPSTKSLVLMINFGVNIPTYCNSPLMYVEKG